MKNKGFSLVELIIVIAIMAILAAAIAPALIRYIDKSRKADDLAAAETINTAVSAALANEDAYSEVAGVMDGTTAIASATQNAAFTGTGSTFIDEINSSCGGVSPKLKYTKNSATGWEVRVSNNGKPMVFVVAGQNKIELQPEINKDYK